MGSLDRNGLISLNLATIAKDNLKLKKEPCSALFNSAEISAKSEFRNNL